MRKEAITLPVKENTLESTTYEKIDMAEDVVYALARATDEEGEQVGLVAIQLHFEQREKVGYASKLEESIAYYLEAIRRLVRKTDHVLLLEQSYYVILGGADKQGALIVQERLWEALLWCAHNAPERDLLRPQRMQIGYSAYPEPYTTLQQCLAFAQEPAMHFVLQPKASSQQVQHLEETIVVEHELSHLARQLGIPYLSQLPQKLPTRLRRIVSPQLALELQCFPIGRERDTLTVAMLDPQNSQALERLRQETGLHIFPVLTDPLALQSALAHL